MIFKSLLQPQLLQFPAAATATAINHDHQPSADPSKGHRYCITSGVGGIDTFPCRMDTRRDLR